MIDTWWESKIKTVADKASKLINHQKMVGKELYVDAFQSEIQVFDYSCKVI